MRPRSSCQRTDPGALFRREALEYLASQRGPGEPLHGSTTWTEWGYWGLLALILAGLMAGCLVHIGSDPLLFVLAPALKALFEHTFA